MRYCSKCGRKLSDNEAFCPGCGNRMNKKTNTANSSKQAEKKEAESYVTQTKPESADANSVQYVYVNKKTGKITSNPQVKTKSEGCLQFVGIAIAAIALILIMVSGTVLLTNYFSEDARLTDDDDSWFISSLDHVTSMEESSEVSSDPVSSESVSSEIVSSEIVSSEIVSSEPVSSESVSSASSVSEELTAKYMNKKIKGKWRTDVPYKNMSLPGIFEFDGKGKAKCTIKAFLFSKNFSGTYKIKDGGKCILTLDGLEEYFDGDTLEGNLRFVTDDQIEFTVEDTVWKLTRTE